MRYGSLLMMMTLIAPLPAEAITLHRPFGSVSIETNYDDNISGRSAVEAELYPMGNTDWRGTVALGGGTDISFDDHWSLYVGGRLRSFRFLNYPDFSGMIGTATTELSGYGLPLGIDSFLSYGFTTDGSQSRSHTVALSLERRLAGPWTLFVAGGHYWHMTAATGFDNRGPFSDGGIRLDLPTRTSLSAVLSFLGRGFDYGRSDQIVSASLIASQRIWDGTYMRAVYRHDRSRSNEPERNFPGNAFTLGTSYYF